MTSISIHISCFVVFACLPYLWAKNALPFLERSLLLWEREEKDNESVQNPDEDESLAESPAATEGWTAWGPWLSCSRTCDGGIAISLRECRGKCPTGQPIRRQICNMQPCPEASDFRAAQCAAYDDRPYRGRKYSWVPFHDPEDPCALTCRARGYNFVAKHSNKVQDGTRCREGALDMCVDGQCQSIGCDLRVGSNLKVDECGICGGDGSTCQKPTFIWQEGDYGECSVTCGGGIQLSESFCRNKETNEEVDQRLCNLSIRPRTKAKHCNRFPCPVVWATGQWGPCSATCGPGVQSRPVFCVQGGPNGTQIDVKSEFCPRHKPMTERSCSIEECPRWFQGPWTPCSATCGTGVQNRAVVCRDTRSQYSDLCDPSDMPRRQRNCDARQPCPTTAPEESTTPPPCVYTPSTEGEIETTTTEEPTTPTMPVIILTQAPFNLTTEVRTFYFVGPWGRCNGQGYRRRIVHCQIYIDNSHTPAWLPDYECPEIRPADLEPCTVPCPPPHPPRQLESVREVEPPFVEKVVEVEEEKTFYSWNTEKFTPCSTTCGGGVHSSMVRCLRLPDEVEVSAQLCDLSLKPEPLTRKCNLQPCPQIYRWNATEFGNCSHECGGGTRKRLVKCILLTNGQEVTSVHCSGQPPTAIEQCNVFDCPPAWRAEQWSKCSKSCGGGFQTRKLHCEKVLAPLSQTIQLPPSKCLKTRPKAVKKCNLKPCPPPPRTTTTTSTTTTTTTTTTVAPTTDDVDDYEIVTNYPDEQVFVQKQPNRRVTLKASGQAILFKGSNAKFHCPVPQPLTPSLNTSLLSNPRVLWFKGHRRIPPQSANGWPRVAVSGKGALRIHKTTLADSGNYTCLAGAFRSDVLVKVRPLPARIHQENVLISTTSTTTDPSAETRNRKLTNRSALPQVRHFLVNMRHFAEERTRSRSDPVVLEYEWIIGVWSPCSHTCGKLGTQVRTIECQVRVLGNATRLVPRSLCEGGLEEPIAIRPCSLDPCPEWITGDWSECSLKNCLSWNISYQKRSVVCGIANITVTPSHCDANQRPRRKRECRHGLCRGHWKVGQWTECTAPCGHQGFRSRSVQCVWQGNQESAPTTACKSPSPPTSSSCGRTPCKDEEEVECYDQSTYCDVVKKAKLCQMSHFRIQCCASCSSQD